MVVPDEEGLPRHVLVLHDPMRNEVTGTCDRLGDGCLAVGKVDPLRVLDDLIAVENVEIKVGHGLKPYNPGKVPAPPGRSRSLVLCKNIGCCRTIAFLTCTNS